MLKRRDFIKSIGVLGALILTPLGKLHVFQKENTIQETHNQDGELYSGFLLLEMGTSVPSFIEIPSVPVAGYDEWQNPILDANSGVTTYFDDIHSLKSDTSIPIFIPSVLPNRMNFLQGQVIRFKGSDNVWEASCVYGAELGQGIQVYLSARPIFPRPFPVWPVRNLEHDAFLTQDSNDPGIKPDKVDMTPSKGIWFHLGQADSLLWIKHEILYTLTVETQGQSGFTENVVKNLVE